MSGAALPADNFRFNAWGEKGHCGRRQGTLVTTESCLPHPARNREPPKDEMSAILGDYLDVKKVIRLKSGLCFECDPDTDGHFDGVAALRRTRSIRAAGR